MRGRLAAAVGDQPTAQASFDRATAFSPSEVSIRQQYTLALSDTLQYDAALSQAQIGLQLAQAQNRADVTTKLNQIIAAIQARKSGLAPTP